MICRSEMGPKAQPECKSIRFHIGDWPSDDAQLEDLSKSLIEVSRNLQQIEHLVCLSLDALKACKVAL